MFSTILVGYLLYIIKSRDKERKEVERERYNRLLELWQEHDKKIDDIVDWKNQQCGYQQGYTNGRRKTDGS